ncbi:MAG: RNA-binding protein [Myxococcota bacterium]
MSTFAKRERDKRKAEKKREKEMRRRERRDRPPEEPEIVSAEEIQGGMRSIEEVMAQLNAHGPSTARMADFDRPSSVDENARLFVGRLSYDTTDDELAQAFAEFGEVTDAKVILDRNTGQSRGFGFVTLTSMKDAKDAIAAMDGATLDGRTIAVNMASDRA